MKLTQDTVRRIELPSDKSEAIYFDDDIPGFGIRVRVGGSRNWIVQYKTGKKQRRLTLGSTKLLTPTKARESAKDILAKVRLGEDPAGTKAAARAVAADTFKVIAERYLDRQKEKWRPKSYTDTKRYLLVHWKPLHELTLDKINRATIAARLDVLADNNGKAAANIARASLSAFFSWAMRQGICETNPVIGTNKPDDPALRARDRVLSDDELKTIWSALPESDYGDVVKLLILTGCRRDEIGALRRTEIDLEARLIALPGSRTKNKRAHDVHLADAAHDILSAALSRGRDPLFGRGRNGFQGWSKAKKELDDNLLDIAHWRLHDIRRTVATRMGDLGVQPHIIEAVLNHVSGYKAGVAGIYNRAVYSKEKREALELWANHIEVVLSCADNVHRLVNA